MNIKTIIFDIDGTLYDYFNTNPICLEAVAAYCQKEELCSREEFLELNQRLIKDLAEEMGNVAAQHNRIIRYQRILEEKNLPLHPHVLNMYDIYWNTLMEKTSPYPGTEKLLTQLKEKGFRLGVGTDMTSRMQFKKLTSLGLLKYFDFIVTSEEAGGEKPSREFFDICVKKSRVAPAQILFVGDMLEKDVLGAINHGLNGVWFNLYNKPVPKNVTSVSSMDELGKYIDSL